MASKVTWKSIQPLALVMLGICGLAGPVFGQTVITQKSTTKFPIMLTSGSYKLGSNLIPPINTNAIDVNANNVSIDLNGFSIIGSPTTPVLAISASSWAGVVVKNGVLSGFCMTLGQNALVEDIVALNCAMTDGIDVGSNSSVSRSVATSDFIGINCSGSNCSFTDNTVNSSSLHGIGCSGNGCNFSRNTANGNGIGPTVGNGLDCNGTGCLFDGNVSNANIGAGIASFDKTSAMTSNVLNSNGGVPFGGATSLGNNLCNGSPC
jgi:hypothetical protein